MTTVAQYIRHAELFGPECVFETATRELNERDLGKLKAWLDSRQRAYYWQLGRAGGPDSQWKLRMEQPRQCEYCGLDLPPGASRQQRYHGHCKDAAYRARKHDSRRASPPSQ